jgi:hypothetical protein
MKVQKERNPPPVLQKAGRAKGSVWTGAEILAPIGIWSPDSSAVASRYNDWATPAKTKRLCTLSIYHSVQNFLSSSLLPKFVKIKIHRTIIFPVVLNVYSSERGGERCVQGFGGET